MIVRLLTEDHLELLSLEGGCRGSSESTHVKMPHCWKSRALAHIIMHFQGDSGSPLVCDGKLAGVLSYGDFVCRPRFPTIFMAVSKHLGWILDNHFG